MVTLSELTNTPMIQEILLNFLLEKDNLTLTSYF